MKKIMAFIFSLFMGFLPFAAVHAGNDDIPPAGQAFKEKLFELAVDATEWEEQSENSAYWAKKAIAKAKEMGFANVFMCNITPVSGEPYVVLGIIHGGKMFVCDYRQSLCECFNASSKCPSAPLFMQLNIYMTDYHVRNFRPLSQPEAEKL